MDFLSLFALDMPVICGSEYILHSRQIMSVKNRFYIFYHMSAVKKSGIFSKDVVY